MLKAQNHRSTILAAASDVIERRGDFMMGHLSRTFETSRQLYCKDRPNLNHCEHARKPTYFQHAPVKLRPCTVCLRLYLVLVENIYINWRPVYQCFQSNGCKSFADRSRARKLYSHSARIFHSGSLEFNFRGINRLCALPIAMRKCGSSDVYGVNISTRTAVILSRKSKKTGCYESFR